MPTVAFNICCPRDCVSRHNGGTSGAPLKPLRDDSALSLHFIKLEFAKALHFWISDEWCEYPLIAEAKLTASSEYYRREAKEAILYSESYDQTLKSIYASKCSSQNSLSSILIVYLDSTAFSIKYYMRYYPSKSSRMGFTASERTDKFIEQWKNQ